MEFLGIGLPELLVILLITLIVVGPRRLPEMAAQMARFIREFRSYSANLTREVTDALEDFEREYEGVKQEWKEVDEGVRRDARAIEGEVKGAARDASEGLAIDAPKGAPAAAKPKPESGSDGDGRRLAPTESAPKRRPPAG
jgi:sec-independent protein translocase protein TatA